MDDEQTLVLRFAGTAPSLYEVSYIGIDVYQVLAFSKLVDAGDRETLDYYFGQAPPPLNRYVDVLRAYRDTAPRVTVRRGSYEILLEQAPLLAAVLIPILAIYVQRRLSRFDETVIFEVAVEDEELQQLLEVFAKGAFGAGEPALRELFEALGHRGYNITAKQKDLFVIEHVLTRYSRRIVKTLKKNAKTKDF